MKFEHQNGISIEIGGAEIYVEIVGNQDAPPLLLLHGGMGSVEDFNVLVPELGQHFQVIGIDSRGQGKSTLGDKRLTYQRMEEDVIGVLRHLKIEQTAVLGFSDGGNVGYRLMASEAVDVSKLVTIGSLCEFSMNDGLRDIFGKITSEGWREKFPDTYESYQTLNPQPDFDRLVSSVVEMWLDSTATGCPTGIIDRLDGDVLVLRGDGDHLFTRDAAMDVVGRIENSIFGNIPFAGHAAHQDQPEAMLLFISEFLSDNAQ